MTSCPVVPDPRVSAEVDAWELVARAQTGDQSAFGQLYDRYVDVVFRFVLFRVGNRPLAEDLTSETFLRALRRVGSISYQGRDVGAWFVTIARNLVLDHVKSSRYKLEMTTADMLDGDHAPSTDQEVIDRETTRVVTACIARLTPDQRTVVTLQHIHGLSIEQVCAVMGKKDGAVKALGHRGRRALADMWEIRELVTR